MEKQEGRALYSLRESYGITYRAFITVRKLSDAKRQGFLDEKLIERIMLAVTEVNGCAVCSYAHTKMALEAGMTDDEIKNMLAGISENVPAEEMPAIMFAQHYADYRGHPSKDAWDRLVERYKIEKAEGILGAIRMIMLGNAYGVPWSSFFNRFKGKPDPRSNVLYEIGMMICSIVFIPVGLVHALLSNIFKVSLVKF